MNLSANVLLDELKNPKTTFSSLNPADKANFISIRNDYDNQTDLLDIEYTLNTSLQFIKGLYTLSKGVDIKDKLDIFMNVFSNNEELLLIHEVFIILFY